MAREKFKGTKLAGAFKISCKFEGQPTRYWEDRLENVVKHIQAVLAEYKMEGYTLTLRQLHYQLVSRNWIVNHTSAYKKLGDILDACRYGGVIDWNAIEDRGRIPYLEYSVKDIPDAMADTINQYKLNRQEGQPRVVELWTEKDALSGILKRSTDKYHIRLVVNKGYTSSSAVYRSYHRALETISEGQQFVILYFGDHDPSGLDMVRDIRDRLLFMLASSQAPHGLPQDDDFMDQVNTWWEEDFYEPSNMVTDGFIPEEVVDRIYGDGDTKNGDMEALDAGKIMAYLKEKQLFQVVHIGLTMDQIEEYNLPPNPTKGTDSRSEKYVEKYGSECWEVDALKPQTLTAIVEEHVEEHMDLEKYEAVLEKEQQDITRLRKFVATMSDGDDDSLEDDQDEPEE